MYVGCKKFFVYMCVHEKEDITQTLTNYMSFKWNFRAVADIIDFN